MRRTKLMAIKQSLKNKVVPFNFVPFSDKQLKVLTWWMDSSTVNKRTAIICDGSVRAGKTVSLALSYVMWAMEKFNGENFAICGKTVGATNRNIVKPLKQMLKSRGYYLEHDRTEGIISIEYNGNVNFFYVFGGKDEGSQDLIQGITLAGLFCDEVALMPQSFVNQATARCSVEGAKFWFSCNPDSPFHWFKEEWLDKKREKNAFHLHFTMDDNPSLSEEVKDRYKTLYTGVFYQRFILGQWVMADGVVFPEFDMSRHVVTKKRVWTRTFMSCDFGIQNPTTFGIFGYDKRSREYHQIASYYHNGRKQGQKTVNEYVNDCVDFIKANNVIPEYIAVDPSATALIVELRKNDFFIRHNIRIIPAKNNVKLGITFMSFLLKNNKLTLDPSCKEDIKEFTTYVWDADKSEKSGEDVVVKENDHAMDKIRYAVLTDAINNGEFFGEIQLFSGKGQRY